MTRNRMRLCFLACAVALALTSMAAAQNMTGGMVTNPSAPVSNGKATLTATYRNLGPGYAYNVNYDVLVPIQPQTWPPESAGFNAMLNSTIGTDTNGNDVFWGFDTDSMCNYYLLELQRPNSTGNQPMLPNPFPAGASGSFSFQMPIIPMEGVNAGRVVITEPPSLRNSFGVNSAQWETYSWLTMYAGLYNLVSTGALCDEGGTGCANLNACLGKRLWNTQPFEARLQIGRGNSGDPYLGCGTGLTGFTAGNIAVMRRGTCDFTEKLKNAQNAGAAGAILVNDGRCSDVPDSDPDECVITMGGNPGDGYLIDIPSVLMSRRQGEALIGAINGGQTVRAKMGAVPADHVDIFSWVFSDADPNLTNDYLVTRVPINLGGGTCTYSLSPTSANYGASGGNGSFSVTTQTGCAWTATANNNWIHITGGASGTGSGTVSYSVDANGGSSSRSGTISAAGRTFTITQSGTGGGYCIDDPQHGVVCLLNNRYEFYMTWTGFDGVTQPVIFSRQSDQTAAGVFQNNLSDITVVVKVTNGCSFNDHYWVWLGGFTNAAWRLEVTDTLTGTSHVYTKGLSSTPPQTVKDETSFHCGSLANAPNHGETAVETMPRVSEDVWGDLLEGLPVAVTDAEGSIADVRIASDSPHLSSGSLPTGGPVGGGATASCSSRSDELTRTAASFSASVSQQRLLVDPRQSNEDQGMSQGSGYHLQGGRPPVLPDIDPLKQPPPLLQTALSFEPDRRSAVEKIVPTLHEEIARAQAGAIIDIIVSLQEPGFDTELNPGTRAHDDLRAQHIAVLEHSFAAEASFYGFDTKRGLKHSPVVAGRISVQSIAALAGLPMVRAIEFDLPVEAARTEGGGLISAFELQDLGGDGEGIGVAVIDTGIDWTHPELTGQVTAGADYTGTQTSNYGFDDQGHGTACSGIIAGLQQGMAPGAHLWAMKVLDSTGHGDGSWTIAALDVVYEYRNDFGGVHVVNMSLGGGAPINYVCDAVQPAYAAALGQLVNAGITVFAASGNDGCSNGISSPACVSHAISVGAVYDAALGSASFGEGNCMPSGCFDATTAADKITCYSNSGTYLDVLAPSHCADTTELGGGYDSCFGGTSAAAPYSSGVAAQILSLRPSTTPAALRQALKSTGEPITDYRNGLTRHRIDALEAYQYLGGGTCTYSLSPTSATFGVNGGSASFSVSTQAGCSWNATANNGWIHITAGASGTGSGIVIYNVDANSGSSSRTGTISAAGRTFTINQAGSGGGVNCIDDLQHGVVCLRDNRFEFYMTWTGFDGVTQPVLFTRQSDQTAAGVFQNNLSDITVVVKVTNGCSFNDHFWVWLGGFTNAAWRLEVTDTLAGTSHVYTKGLSSTPPQTVKDETSFSCP